VKPIAQQVDLAAQLFPIYRFSAAGFLEIVDVRNG